MAFVAFLKKYYEKLILGSLLLIFIGLLIYLGVLVRKTKNLDDAAWEKTADGRNLPDMVANYVARASKEEPYKVLSGGLKFWKKTSSEEYGDDYDFIIPPPLTICPECKKAIPVADFENKNTDGRIQCSLAGHFLRPPSVLVTVKNAYMDTDGDNIPDDYENRFQKSGHPFNANDKSDAALDFDNDYFNNLDEYYCDLDPLNPKITPLKNGPCGTFKGRLPYHYLLSCTSVSRKRYSFEIAQIDPVRKTVDIKISKRIPEEIRRRTRSSRLWRMERLRGLKVNSTFLSRNEDIKILEIGEKVPENSNLRVRFVKVKDLYTGDEFEVRNFAGNAEDRRNKPYIETPYPRAKLVFMGQVFEKKVGESIKLGKSHTGFDEYTVANVNGSGNIVDLKTADGKIVKIGRETLFSKHRAVMIARKKQEMENKKNQGPKSVIRDRK